MKRRRLAPCGVLAGLIALIAVLVFLPLAVMNIGGHTSVDHTELPPTTVGLPNPKVVPPLRENISMAEFLRFIPSTVVNTWKERDYLIVFGIPSVDIHDWRRRRYLQRTTCWQFPGVARRANNFTGSMLVLYVLARHPSQGYEYSTALMKEAEEWHDILAVSIMEGVPYMNESVSRDGKWGPKPDIGLTRKTVVWLELALRLFPNTSYIAKGDDDMFLRVPQFLADLRVLPKNGVYWGAMYEPKRWVGKTAIKFRFALGWCYTMSRDVVQQIISYRPLMRLVYLPYSEERDAEFLSRGYRGEDSMIGLVLFTLGYYPKILFVREGKCSFHDLHGGVRPFSVNPSSVVIHHVEEKEYMMLMKRFLNNTHAVARRQRNYGKGSIKISCR
ncbi:UDP-Gal or UDP-GlcNAc-dependent glycosyltransferase [Trypanosoma theileri]|uniref:Hexosyltransferase n=1 Tax=Trypanosoma theileri TaxID=67003 RepID=A0A1X0NJC5_9TRYP|nr:UDP-Gal or UDP-GlcNAc-dependent glycosyltransferase [Trypanosoma theileri]ORC84786.1 UDP-Gal or UDP-GlcNAc-dependent glycosyltransferase [Trypanosoma theileri]